jgi:hypothetical protein
VVGESFGWVTAPQLLIHQGCTSGPWPGAARENTAELYDPMWKPELHVRMDLKPTSMRLHRAWPPTSVGRTVFRTGGGR